MVTKKKIIIHTLECLVDYLGSQDLSKEIINQRKTKMNDCKRQVEKKKNRIINLVRFFCVYKGEKTFEM